MQRILMLALVAAAAALPARADNLDVTFSNGTDHGEFVYSTGANAFLWFNIDGRSIDSGFDSSASVTPDLYSAIYQAQISPVSMGGTVNETFVLDLEGLNPWPSADAIALLTNASLPGNLDTANSTINFYIDKGQGIDSNTPSSPNGVTSISTTIPEPSSLALAGLPLLALLRRARGRAIG